jgi:hypothetical protein
MLPQKKVANTVPSEKNARQNEISDKLSHREETKQSRDVTYFHFLSVCYTMTSMNLSFLRKI